MTRYHVECNPEEALLLTFGTPRSDITHHSGSGTVIKTLSENSQLIGLIDEDPERIANHPYYRQCYNNPTFDQNNIRCSIDANRNNKMIFIKPRFEPWIIEVARKAKLTLSDFNLNDDANKLHAEINSKRSDLQKLLHKLIADKNNTILQLRNHLMNDLL